MTALALTDHGNLHGAREVLPEGQGAGHQSDPRPGGLHRPRQPVPQGGSAASKEANYHLTLLAHNRTGFQNLMKLSSAAFLEGFYFKPRIDKELLAAHSEGIICLSGCVSSEFNRTLLAGGEATWRRPSKLPPGSATSSATTTTSKSRTTVWNPAAGAGGRGGGRPADGHPAGGHQRRPLRQPRGRRAQDILLCVNTGKFRTDTNRMRMESNEFFLRSPEEMYAAFPGHGRRPAANAGDRRQRQHRAGSGQAAFPRLRRRKEDLGGLSPRIVPGGPEGALCRPSRRWPTASCRRR